MKIAKIIVLLLVLGFSVTALAAWTPPLASPPDCTSGNPGCDPPINSGPTIQSKDGGFGTLGNLSTGGTFSVKDYGAVPAVTKLIFDFATGRLGIGTATPVAPLSIFNSNSGNSSYPEMLRAAATPAPGYGDEASLVVFSQKDGGKTVLRADSNYGGNRGNEMILETRQPGGGYNVNQLYLSKSGDVGVGANPATGNKLDVSGKIQAAGDVCTSLAGGKCLSTAGGGGGSVSLTSSVTNPGIILSPATITGTGTIGVDATKVQNRVTNSCATGSSIRVINQDGTVSCEIDDLGNHTATIDLNMSNKSINNAYTITSTAQSIGSGPYSGGTQLNYLNQGKNFLRGDTIIADTGGNVGVGTISPGAKLDVNGDVITRGQLSLPGLTGVGGVGKVLMDVSGTGQVNWVALPLKTVKYGYVDGCTLNGTTCNTHGDSGINWSFSSGSATASCPADYHAVGGLSCKVTGDWRIAYMVQNIGQGSGLNVGRSWLFQCGNMGTIGLDLAEGRYLDMINVASLTCVPDTAF